MEGEWLHYFPLTTNSLAYTSSRGASELTYLNKPPNIAQSWGGEYEAPTRILTSDLCLSIPQFCLHWLLFTKLMLVIFKGIVKIGVRINDGKNKLFSNKILFLIANFVALKSCHLLYFHRELQTENIGITFISQFYRSLSSLWSLAFVRWHLRKNCWRYPEICWKSNHYLSTNQRVMFIM